MSRRNLSIKQAREDVSSGVRTGLDRQKFRGRCLSAYRTVRPNLDSVGTQYKMVSLPQSHALSRANRTSRRLSGVNCRNDSQLNLVSDDPQRHVPSGDEAIWIMQLDVCRRVAPQRQLPSARVQRDFAIILGTLDKQS